MSGLPLQSGRQQHAKALLSRTSLRQKFTPEEDIRLKQLVAELGTKAWKKVSARMPDRTTRQCRERYNNYLSPLLNMDPWTADEDKLLEEKVKEMGQKWSIIAHFFNGRSDVNVKNRYALLVSKGLAQPGISFHPSAKKHYSTPEHAYRNQVYQQKAIEHPIAPKEDTQQQKQQPTELTQIEQQNPDTNEDHGNDDPINHIFDNVMDEEEDGDLFSVANEGADWSFLTYDFETDEIFSDQKPIIPTTAML